MSDTGPRPGTGGSSYAAAGVDIEAGETAVARIRALVDATTRPEVLSGIGGFAGLFSLDSSRRDAPVLVASTDGVGTKVLVARSVERYRTIGVDLVAMCVDDVVCAGAEPLFLLDYISTGRLLPERIAEVVHGVAEGCRLAGCALLGGETAEHPDAMEPDDLDLAGFALGVVERHQLLGPDRVAVGDVLVGLQSPGLRSNGYSLARQVLLARAGLALEGPAWPGADHSLGDELLVPSRIYAPAVLQVLSSLPGALHAAAHITGGGIPGNLPRALPQGCDARVESASWAVPRIFEEIRRLGTVDDEEMRRVFNLGIGMVLVMEASSVEAATKILRAAGEEPVVVGQVTEGTGEVCWR